MYTPSIVVTHSPENFQVVFHYDPPIHWLIHILKAFVFLVMVYVKEDGDTNLIDANSAWEVSKENK